MDNRRHRGGGGGGGGYGGGGRKRGREDDDEYDNRRAPPNRRHDHGPPRRHQEYEEPPSSKLRRLILNIASSTKLPQDEAVEIAELLSSHFRDHILVQDFLDTAVQLIIEQPFRIPFVAAVALYANSIEPEVTAEALRRVTIQAQEALNEGKWKEVKLLLRFLACLQSQYEGDGVFAFLGQLFDTVVDLQSANENDMLGIELVKIILLTIPYAIKSGGSQFHEQAQEMLKNTSIVASNMLPIEGLIHSYNPESDDSPIGYHSLIGLLQQQLSSEAESGWDLAIIPSFDPNYMPKKENDEMNGLRRKHAFPQLKIPSPVNPGSGQIFQESYFSLYIHQDIETVPKLDNIASSLIRDTIVDTIDQLDFNREQCAKFLVDLDCYWSEKTFAKRGIPYDKFREAIGDSVLWKSEDMITDAIFSQLFKLPMPQHKLVYYDSLIMACCKCAPAAVAPSLGRGIRALYKNLKSMDLQLANRFLDWFVHHLSNFEFRWRWPEWVEDVELPDLDPKKAFIISAIEKEIRLSFAKRIRSTLPDDMHHLIPGNLDDDHSPDFKYENPDTPFAAEGQTLLLQLRKKAPPEEIQDTFNKIHEKAIEQGIADVIVPSMDAFVTSICRLGSKSLSHVLSAIERGKQQLLVMAESSDAARIQVIASVNEYWKSHPGTAVRIVDFLLNFEVVHPQTIIQWALGDHLGAGEVLAKSWLFDLTYTTVDKVTRRSRTIVEARLQPDLDPRQIPLVDEALVKDRADTRQLFKFIDDQLKGIVDGTSATLMEKERSGEISSEDGTLIRAWAARWRTVFLRKQKVEESISGEAAVEAAIKLIPAPTEVQAPAAGLDGLDGTVDDMDVAHGDVML